ncbi:MAG TPA: thioredoxin domain-containing protein, partial [Leptospiraceae bacterium]|nr:thioredoxin domain-containing protein [Leptospiraceae bacterium]
MNSNRKPNRLIEEKSPYLLQHAYNPVDWYPWCEEAFEKAKREDKIVILSIGYATCHWCHVMEKESFEDERTAEIMNRDFVAIKVDREERPDIDKIYMDALHAMDQQGGWPLNMFLTPDKKPVAGGTYFPPVQKYGRKSFTEILAIIKNVWDTRKQELIDSSEAIASYLQKENLADNPDLTLPPDTAFSSAYQMYDRFFDDTYYGFKTNMVNKFPPSMGLSFLLFHYHITKETKALHMVEKTLMAMKRGGIYDQIGGGLCRYATDGRWLVPHFEKMLYDNSLFIEALRECYQVTQNPFYKEVVYDIVKYIRRDMTLKEGVIASAEDADSEGEEGKFYLWSLEEFRSICKEDSEVLEKFWNVTEEGNFEEKNILNETFDIDFIKENNLNREEFQSIVQRNKEKLLDVRAKRIRPLRDDKVLTSWNCLYLKAITGAAIAFGDKSLLADAIQIFDFIQKNLFNENCRLLRRYRTGESKILAYLTDYAELTLASIYLYKATYDLKYIKTAAGLAEETIRLFQSEKGVFYDTGIDGEALIRRSIDAYDGVEPSGNSSMAHAFNFLS